MILVACPTLWLACATIPGFSVAPPGSSDADPNPPDVLFNASDASDADASAPLGVDAGRDSAVDAELPKCTKCMIFMTALDYFGVTVESKANADKICATTAAGPPALSGTWMALIWEKNAPVPLTLVKPSSEGWYQVGPGGLPGEKVLTSLTTAGRTDAGILTQFSQAIPGATVWTGGDEQGTSANCADWKQGAVQGVYGDPNTGSWLSQGTVQCSFAPRRIYCIQQTP